ncbi:hypothetical protein ACJJTC_014472 [Scirpophaga incertulas]
MVKCAVLKYKNDSRKQTKKDNNIYFHRFPKNLELTKKWVTAIRRPDWEPNIRSFVCSVHFSASSIFETQRGLCRLDEAIEDSIENIVIPPTMDESAVNDTPRKRKLKWQIANLKEIAKRRRIRCNALYSQKRRLKKKIVSVTEMLTQLREKRAITQEQRDILEICSAPAAELFRRMRHKGMTYSASLRSFLH